MEHNFSLKQVPRWVFPVLAVILVFTIGSAVHSAGWSQGFTMGLLAGNAGDGAITPYLAYRGGYGFHPFGLIGGFFGMIFRIGFFLLIFGMIAKFLGFCRWKRHGGHHGGGYYGEYEGKQGWHKPHSHWGQQPPQQSPEQPSQPGEQPDDPSGDPETHKPQQTGWTQV